MMELINAPGWARNVYPVTYLSGSTQDCADLHSFGPGMREIYILHYVLRGRGVFEENGRVFPVETGGTFLVRPQRGRRPPEADRLLLRLSRGPAPSPGGDGAALPPDSRCRGRP